MTVKCFRNSCGLDAFDPVAIHIDCGDSNVFWVFPVCPKCQNAAKKVRMVAAEDIILAGEKRLKENSNLTNFKLVATGDFDYCEKCGCRPHVPLQWHECKDSDGLYFYGSQVIYQYE